MFYENLISIIINITIAISFIIRYYKMLLTCLYCCTCYLQSGGRIYDSFVNHELPHSL